MIFKLLGFNVLDDIFEDSVVEFFRELANDNLKKKYEALLKLERISSDIIILGSILLSILITFGLMVGVLGFSNIVVILVGIILSILLGGVIGIFIWGVVFGIYVVVTEMEENLYKEYEDVINTRDTIFSNYE